VTGGGDVGVADYRAIHVPGQRMRGVEWQAGASKTWQPKHRDGGRGQAPKPRSGAAARPDAAQSVILLMHIRPDQYAFVGCRRLQRYGGATVLYR
jgi:hypothetical protein